MESLGLFLVLFLVCPVLPLGYSVPAVQKCEVNKLGLEEERIEVPSHRMSTGEEFTFRITEKCATRLPHCLRGCSTPMTSIQVSMTPRVVDGNGTIEYHEVEDSPMVTFTPKSYMRVDNEYFSSDEWCLYSKTESHVVIKVCPFTCGGGDKIRFEVCVPKCCSIHKVLDVTTDSCEYSAGLGIWEPDVYKSSSRQICGEKRVDLKFHYVQAPPECEVFDKYFLKSVAGSTRVRFRFLIDGGVVLRELGAKEWVKVKSGGFCIDGVAGEGDRVNQVLLICSKNISGGVLEDGEEREVRLTASGIAYIVLLFSGIPFLLVTEIVYVLVWTDQNVHGWTLFSHTLAVLLHYLAQGIANTLSRILNSDQNGSHVCMVVGILNHLFVLASFFWLTAINYDLFSMFRHLKTTVGRSRGVKRFVVYSVVAWGVPIVVVGVSVWLDLFYGLYGDDGECEVDVIVPLYGHKTCYMTADSMPYYLYYPVAGIMVVNLILAGFTFFNTYRHDLEAKRLHGEISMKHRRKFWVMAKLFVVMGLVWVFEMFVWTFIDGDEVLPWYLVFPDVFNFLQAVAIFLLFACQPKILGQVARRYPRLVVFTEMLKKLNCGEGGKLRGGGGSSSVAGGLEMGASGKL